MKKKILSIALVLCMIFETVPAETIFAAGKEETIRESGEANTESQENEKTDPSIQEQSQPQEG